MKLETVKELRTKVPVELEKSAAELRDKLWSLRADLEQGKVKNVKEIHDIKKTIARILTVLKQSQDKK